jgi:anti-sigma factor ChrR (cupin superfamily)
MADDEAMSVGMASLELAGGAGGAEPDGDVPLVVVPPVIMHAAAHPIAADMAAGFEAVGESILAPSLDTAVSSIAPTAREAIISARARIAASAARIPPVCDVTMHDGSAHMPVRHEFNWLSVTITYSKDRKYDGLSIVPQSQDQKSRFQLFRCHVGAYICICQGPCHDQESVDMVES